MPLFMLRHLAEILHAPPYGAVGLTCFRRYRRLAGSGSSDSGSDLPCAPSVDQYT